MDVLVYIVCGVFHFRRCAQATGLADKSLVKHPGLGRPHKSFVIKTRRKQGRAPAVGTEQAREQAGPAVDALGIQALVQLDLGHLGVGDGVRTALDLHQCRRFFNTGGHDTAWTVVFPGPRKQAFACRQQGRSQGVAGIAAKAAAIEGEADRGFAVDAAAQVRYTLPAHAAAPAPGAPSGFSPGL